MGGGEEAGGDPGEEVCEAEEGEGDGGISGGKEKAAVSVWGME